MARPSNPRRTCLSLSAIAALAAALGACGSSHSVTNANTAGGALQVAKCMRAHGVPNFPDPTQGGGINITPGDGLNPQSPSFQSAMVACKNLLGPKGPAHPLPAQFRRQAIANARCMREHGVPNFPDPTFPPSGGMLLASPAGASANSPAFQHAQRICGTAVPGAKRTVAIGG